MARSPNQKLKTLILQKTLLERTDEEHPMTVRLGFERLLSALTAH